MSKAYTRIKFCYRLSENDILVDLSAVSKTRSVLMLIAPLLAMNKSIVIRLRANAAVIALLKGLSAIENVRFVLIPKGLRKARLVIKDVKNGKENEANVMLLSYSYKPNLKSLSFPYLMHHWRYIKYDYSIVADLRQSARRIKIFFSGNADPNHYDDERFSTVYNMLNRHQIVEVYKKLVTDVVDVNQFYAFMETEEYMKVCFLNRVKGGIKSRLWLNALALSDFFLAPPGVIMPMSHNIIEAMSVGTIPITNYAKWFNPPLKNGIHCITFQTVEEEKLAIETAKKMSSEKREEMRQNVINYYETYLNPFSWYKRNVLDSTQKVLDVSFLDEDFEKIKEALKF